MGMFVNVAATFEATKINLADTAQHLAIVHTPCRHSLPPSGHCCQTHYNIISVMIPFTFDYHIQQGVNKAKNNTVHLKYIHIPEDHSSHW